MAKRYPQSWWCFFRDNSTIRNLVAYFIKERGQTLTGLAKIAGCQPNQIRKYLDDKKPHITQYQLMAICNHLGIEPSMQVGLTDAVSALNP